MSLKAYQTPKPSTTIFNSISKVFTALESYQGVSHFIFQCDNHSRNKTFMLQGNVPLCMRLIGLLHIGTWPH